MGNANLRRWLWVAGITVLTTVCVLVGRAIMPWEKMFPDYIHHWTAGRLIGSGQSPYDVDLQARIHRELGWSRATHGRGILDFLPFYYPPWFALACALLVPLGYEGGKVAWFFLNLELLFLTGLLLRGAVAGLPGRIPLVSVPFFLFSVLALLIGQTPILVLFLAALAWRLLDAGRDRFAGAALACLTIKPQLAAVFVLAMGIWAVRRGRWGVVQGFALTLALVCLVSALIVPSWPIEMLGATRRTPPPTEYFPWLGTTWFLILRTLGLRTWWLWILYLAVAIPLLWRVLMLAFDLRSPLGDVMAVGLLAAFFVAPYARHYDFVVLLIPSFVLIGSRLSERAGALLLIGLLVVPYLQFILLARYSRLVVPNVDFFLECTYFWIPTLLAGLWIAMRSRSGEVGARGV
jgi:hypothetical protein